MESKIQRLNFLGINSSKLNPKKVIHRNLTKLVSHKNLLTFFSTGTDAQSSTNSTKQFPLNSSEELYSELRDKNFNAVGPILSRKARIISAAMEEMRVGKSVQDLKAFVMEKIPQMKSLKQSVTIHTSIAELVKEKIDNPASLEFLQVEQELVNNQKVYIT